MQAHTKQTIRIFWKTCLRYPIKLFVVVFFAILASLAATYAGVVQKQLIDALTNELSFAEIKGIIFHIYAILALMWLSWRIAGYTNANFQTAGKRDLYRKCFEYMHGHSASFFNGNFVGSLVRRINKYERAFEDITDQFFWNLIPTFFSLLLVLIVLWRTNTTIAAIFTIWTLVYLIFSYFYALRRMKYDMHQNELDSKATGFVADTISNQNNLKLFASLGFEQKSFWKLTDEWRKSLMKSWNVGITQEALQGVMMIGVDFIIIYISVKLWSEGKLTIGDIVMIQTFMGRIFDKLWEIGRNIRRLYQGIADANEMTEILLTPHEVVDVKEAKALRVKSGGISFHNVQFGYHRIRPVLNNFNLDINSGEKLALVGPSGGGKSTIVKLLLRFVDIQKGSITIDGQDIAHVTQDSLRKNVALVPQDPILFHRTLLENIRYGKPTATKAEIINAAKQSHCHEFISRLETGYDTYVGERGVKLSGGERQRVAIARAILKNAPILILDEATSSLDSESEQLIQDALHALMKNKTVIVIAHRLSTIMQMDRIVVIEKGKIKEQGKHGELLKMRQGTYQKLWHIQAGGFS